MDSKLIICQGIKIDKSYTNVLSYNLNSMLALVDSKAVYSQTNYNYIDYTKNEIMADVDYATAVESNYIAFQNPRHGNKWHFAFIDDVRYKAPFQTLITFTIDVWSTFHDDWTAKPCFVIREHVNDDTMGLHTVPENVTTGDYVIGAHLRDSYNRQTGHIIVASNIDSHIESGEPPVRTAGMYNGIPYSYGLFDCGTDANNLLDFINDLSDQQNAIQNVFFAPPWICGTPILNWEVPQSTAVVTQNTGIDRITSLDGYTPKNKKLLTYPYCYILATNGQNQNAIYMQELWDIDNNNEMVFRMYGALTPGCSIRGVPINYKGDEVCDSEGINLGKFPTLSWSTDFYTLWCSDNLLNNTSSLINTASDFSSGNYIGGAQSIANILYSDYKAQRVPPQIHGNTNCGDVMYSMRENCFHLYRMTIRKEYAEQIDDYFSRYGYKINDTKLPNLSGRQNFNFVEIGKDECIGYGKVPSKYMDEINNICRQGVTIWHNHDNLGNYNVSNNIV